MYIIAIPIGLTDDQHAILSVITVPDLVLSMWHSIVSRKFFFSIDHSDLFVAFEADDSVNLQVVGNLYRG